MTQTVITVDLQPVPASRPRVSKFKNKKTGKMVSRTYYLPTYEKYKNALHQSISQKWNYPTIQGAVEVFVLFQFQMPNSWSKKEKDLNRGKPVTLNKGDLDNLEKALYDAMNGTVFEDDSQIWQHGVCKIWGDTGKTSFIVKETSERRFIIPDCLL